MPAVRLGPSLRVRRTLQRALAGEPPDRQEAIGLLAAEGPDFWALVDGAGRLRDQRKGRVLTFSRKVFIPLTNLCRDRCGYCAFVKQPREPGARTLTPEEVLSLARAGEKLGCKEALFSLGDKPEARYPEYRAWLRGLGYGSTVEYLRAMCALVAAETGLLPHANPGVMTEAEMAALRPFNVSMGLMLETVSKRLLRPGMAHHRCPDKVPALRLRTMEAAGRLKVAFNTGILVGIGETAEERIDSLLAIRQLHERYGHIQEVIIQNFRPKAGTPMAGWPAPGLGEMLRTIAVARLLLPDMNLQAPPNLAPADYRLYLWAGINDWGGISPLTPDFINPEAPWPKLGELKDICRAEGFELRERLAIYPEYIKPEFVPAGLWPKVAALTDEKGLVRPELEGPYRGGRKG